MSLKVTTDIQCDHDTCTETADVNIVSSSFATKEARAAAKAKGWTTSRRGNPRWFSDYCPEHSHG